MHLRPAFLSAALCLFSCTPPAPSAPVDTWAELTFGLRLAAGTSPQGASSGAADISDLRVAAAGATALRVVEAELQVLEFDVNTPVQLASGELGLAASAGATPLLVIPWRDLPIGENGRKKLTIPDAQSLASLLGQDAVTYQLRYVLDDTPASFNLLTRVRFQASFE